MGLQKIKNRISELFSTNKAIKETAAETVSPMRLFHFQPFEIKAEFNGKPHAFAKAFWQGQERQFALAIVDGWVRFCEVDQLESGQWNFVVPSRIPHISNSTKVNPNFVENVFQSALKNQEFGRLFRYAVDNSDRYGYNDWETDTQWVFVGFENRGMIEFNDERAYFGYQTSLSLIDSSISQWYIEMESWIAESESDFSFLFRWNKSDDIAKAWTLNHLANGTDAELDAIARLILSFEDAFIKEARVENAERILVNIRLGTTETPAIVQDISFSGWYDEEISRMPTHFQLWEVFLRYFEPQIDPQILERYLPDNFKRDYSLVFATGTEETTAHERLEVRLKLAEWLQGKVSDEQIDLLLAG